MHYTENNVYNDGDVQVCTVTRKRTVQTRQVLF